MPHDINGNLLKAGDRVTIECIVKSIQPNTEYCNVTLETVEPMFPGNNKDHFTLNTKQIKLVEVEQTVATGT